MLDPRDSGTRGAKEWEEFRASFAAAFLLSWLLDESRDVLAGFAEDLHDRFMSGWDIQETLELDPDIPQDERDFPLPPRGGVAGPLYPDEIAWMYESEARLLYDQLFPHQESLNEFATSSMGLAVVALHSALEAYLRGIGVHDHGSMPRAVERYLRDAGEPLDSDTMSLLRACDATRHLIIHHRGVVADRYLRNTVDPAWEIGENRTVSGSDLHSFARAVWRTAELVRKARAHGDEP